MSSDAAGGGGNTPPGMGCAPVAVDRTRQSMKHIYRSVISFFFKGLNHRNQFYSF